MRLTPRCPPLYPAYHLKVYHASKASDELTLPSLRAYQPLVNALCAWVLVVQCVYFVLALAADLVATAHNTLLTLRDKLYFVLAFPTAVVRGRASVRASV